MAMKKMYSTVTFADIFSSDEIFKSKINTFTSQMTDAPFITANNQTLTFVLLYAKYGNSPIGSSDENQFVAQVWSTIMMYGPSWEKRLDIQSKLRNLTEDQIKLGSKTIMNQALNPDQTPSSEEVDYINQQNTNKSTKSVLGAYAELVDLIETDVTKEYIDKFKPLFKKVVLPEYTNIYLTEVTDE